MYHRWICTHDDRSYVEYYTKALLLDELLDDFKSYLQGCGFSLKSSEEITIIDTSEDLYDYVYVVTMERVWGGAEGDTYLVGVYSTFDGAKDAAIFEEEYKGWPFKGNIERRTVDKLFRDYEEEEI